MLKTFGRPGIKKTSIFINLTCNISHFMDSMRRAAAAFNRFARAITPRGGKSKKWNRRRLRKRLRRRKVMV